MRPIRWAKGIGTLAVGACMAQSALAHPHVFVDGGVDFVMGAQNMLTGLKITWRYDAFETLYILSSHDIGLNKDGALAETDRQRLITYRSDWPEDFDGSAHLTLHGAPLALNWPENLDLHLRDGRLEISFERSLETPVALAGQTLDLAFYESTYFFAFSLTEPSRFVPLRQEPPCAATLFPFDAEKQHVDLQKTLLKLSREETPSIANVGALFADRIVLQCE